MASLRDRVVIITGASSGIGAATAHALVAEGCKVVLAARSQDKLTALATELAPHALAVPTDVTQAGDLKQLVDKTLEHFGQIDALLANAGIYLAGDVVDDDLNTWTQLINVNVNGVLNSIHAVLPHFKTQRRGDILITSSISGFEDIVWEPIYSASKHAVQGLAHTLRRQLAGLGIRVGAICPGKVANELWGFTDTQAVDEDITKHASIRSEDVAEAIIFMLSRPAHVTIRDLVMLPQNQDI
ncbi:MAG: SDR family oxidoreductase [Deinococcota bacterium]